MNRVPRVYHPEELVSGSAWVPDRATGRHLLRVLRLKDGQEVELLDGRGGVGRSVLHVSGDRPELRVHAVEHKDPPRPFLRSWLPLIKPSRLEWAVEKCCELGVGEIVVYTSALTGNRERRPDAARLGRILEAALLQSANPILPALRVDARFEDLQEESAPLAWADPHPEGDPALLLAGSEELALVCGPEGGFSMDERSWLEAHARLRLAFGPHTLRAETAAVALAAALRCLAAL